MSDHSTTDGGVRLQSIERAHDRYQETGEALVDYAQALDRAQAAELSIPLASISHNVLIEPLKGGGFLVRDPIGVGYTYLVDSDWISQYVYGATWRE